MAEKYPQEIYAVVVCVIQLKWVFLKCVKKDTRQAFSGVGKVLWGTFLPHLLFGRLKTLPPIVVAPSIFPVNKSGLVLHNPLT